VWKHGWLHHSCGLTFVLSFLYLFRHIQVVVRPAPAPYHFSASAAWLN